MDIDTVTLIPPSHQDENYPSLMMSPYLFIVFLCCSLLIIRMTDWNTNALTGERFAKRGRLDHSGELFRTVNLKFVGHGDS